MHLGFHEYLIPLIISSERYSLFNEYVWIYIFIFHNNDKNIESEYLIYQDTSIMWREYLIFLHIHILLLIKKTSFGVKHCKIENVFLLRSAQAGKLKKTYM